MKNFRYLIAALVAIIFGLGTIAFATTAPAATPTLATPVRTVKSLANGQTVETYRYGGEADEVGDVYYDTDWVGTTTKRAAVVVIHGGWWHNGTRDGEAAASQRFLDAGFVVFNIDYRVAAVHSGYAGSTEQGLLLPGTRWPAQRQDAAVAYDWLKANAALFNVDPTRVAAYGSSAGGHIAHIASGYYGTSKYAASVSVGGVMQPTRVAGIVNLADTSIAPTSTYAKSFGYMTSVIGCSWEPTWYDCGNRWKSFKPDTYFGADKPPIYVVKGANDPVEPTAVTVQSVNYWMNYSGQKGVTVTAPNRGHEETTLTGTGTEDNARWNAMLTWLRAQTA